MEMKNKVELIKRLDEHDVILSWSSTAPAPFIVAAINDFKAFIDQKIKEAAAEVKADVPVQDPVEAPKAE